MVLQAVQVEVAAGLVVRVIPFVPLLVVDGGGEEAVEDVRSKRGTGRGGSRCLAFASREVSAQVVVRVVERNGGGVLGANRSLDGGSTQVRRRPRRAVSASPGGTPTVGADTHQSVLVRASESTGKWIRVPGVTPSHPLPTRPSPSRRGRGTRRRFRAVRPPC
jgi:hypothetical protein